MIGEIKQARTDLRQDWGKIISALRNHVEKHGGPEKGNFAGTIAAIGGLFVSVLGAGVIPLIVFPLIDYGAYTEGPSDKPNVIIIVKNIGFTSAKNVVVSIRMDNGTFSNLKTDPYFGEQFKKNITGGVAYGKLEVLPPRATVKFTGETSADPNKTAQITPYVFSDDELGKINRLWSLCFYTILAAVYSFLFNKLYFIDQITDFTRADVIGGMLLVFVYVFSFFVLYNVVAIIPTYPKSNPAFPI